MYIQYYNVFDFGDMHVVVKVIVRVVDNSNNWIRLQKYRLKSEILSYLSTAVFFYLDEIKVVQHDMIVRQRLQSSNGKVSQIS